MGLFPSFSSLLRIAGGLILVSIASTAGLLYVYQTSLIYPSSFPSGSRTQVSTPDEYDLPFSEESLLTPDGIKLRLFIMLQGKKLATNKIRKIQHVEQERKSTPDQTGKVFVETYEPQLAATRPTILFLHANAGNMGHRLPLASVLFKRFGCNVVMLSYRGYGFSNGSPNERGIRIDTQTTLDFIRKHPSLSKSTIVAYGQSIGGAVALDLASRNHKSVHALILENTFTSIPELIPHVLPPVKIFAFLCREFWPSRRSITKLPSTLPVLFLSGRQDELVPPSHMDTLFSLCPSKHKVWKSFQNGTHNDTCVNQGYFEAISDFLLEFVVPRGGSDDGEWEKMSESELKEAGVQMAIKEEL